VLHKTHLKYAKREEASLRPPVIHSVSTTRRCRLIFAGRLRTMAGSTRRLRARQEATRKDGEYVREALA